MVATTQTRPVQEPLQDVPRHLVYEIIDGKPFYYKGYRDVLQKTKTREDIMGSSSLQALIVGYIFRIIATIYDEDHYFILTSEAGLHLNHRTNLANDIAVFDQKVLPPSRISTQYADVPPELAIEVDVKAALEDLSETGYIYLKTRKLLQFGVKKVFWLLTEAQVVMVATASRMETFEWSQDVEITTGHTFNVAQYLQKRGITT